MSSGCGSDRRASRKCRRASLGGLFAHDAASSGQTTLISRSYTRALYPKRKAVFVGVYAHVSFGPTYAVYTPTNKM